jgi:hypothetical protein
VLQSNTQLIISSCLIRTSFSCLVTARRYHKSTHASLWFAAVRLRALPAHITVPLLSPAHQERASERRARAHDRWDGKMVADFVDGQGATYGDYVLSKVAKVFPVLAEAQLRDNERQGAQQHHMEL